MSIPQTPLFDFDSGAAYLHTTPRHLRRLWQTRKLGGVRVGRLIRFTESDLETFIARGRVEAIQSPSTVRVTRPLKVKTATKVAKSRGAK